MSAADVQRLLTEAADAVRTGDLHAAARLTEQALALDPSNADSSMELGRLLLALRRPEDAEAAMRRGLAAAPGHFGLLANLGIHLCQTGRPEEGIGWLRRATAVDPRSPAAQYNLANALKSIGAIDECIDRYRTVLTLDESFAPAYRNLGNALVSRGDVDEAAAAYARATELRHGPAAIRHPRDRQFTHTSATKLRHDIEQIAHLASRLGPRETVDAGPYEAALKALPAGAPTHAVPLPETARGALAPSYNRLWHVYDAPARAGGAVSPGIDRAAVEADYALNQPGITHVDDFLRPEALAELRRFCLESTVWFNFQYANGYLGAFWEDGFWCPLLAQIAEELRHALPGIFKQHTLRKAWAFKYDSRLSGIPMHADFAAVNVNFWITPDSANLDPAHGGLVVWDKEAPADWDFATYNKDEAAMRAFLARSGARSVTVPHRQNRVVIFNSDLIHATDRIAFAEGYENRRINITLLYGVRG